MFFFGAGPVLILSSAGVLVAGWRNGLLAQVLKTRSSLWLGACLALQLLYFMFMIPKLGPILDIDLFFTVYLTIGFVAGALGDKMLQAVRSDVRSNWTMCFVAASLGSSSVIMAQLLWIGIR
jgi:hypothetical protein